MSLTSKLNGASISDIHLLHPNTLTSHIVRGLGHAFPDNDTTSKLDIVFIVGDVFDQIGFAPDRNVRLAKVWINQFLRLCAKHGIVVVVLEGTPKHDRKQNDLFVQLKEMGEIPVELYYIDKLDILFIEKHGIHVLCVPDEWTSGSWGSNTLETWNEVQGLLARYQLTQVDFTLLHGAFDYQLPPTKPHLVHRRENYESITRHLVLSGHIHFPSQRGSTLTNGSFDRLGHGEEHPKGHWRFTVDPHGKTKTTFVENTNAKIYKTISIRESSIEGALAQITHDVVGLPEDSRLRVKASAGHPIMASLEVLRKQYPQYQWSGKAIEEDSGPTAIQQLEDTTPVIATEITPDNIYGMVDAKLLTMGVDAATRQLCARRLRETIHDVRN